MTKVNFLKLFIVKTANVLESEIFYWDIICCFLSQIGRERKFLWGIHTDLRKLYEFIQDCCVKTNM